MLKETCPACGRTQRKVKWQPKFKIGQEVWYMWLNRPVMLPVFSIHTTDTANGDRVFEYGLGTQPEYVRGRHPEHKVFPTLEALIQALIDHAAPVEGLEFGKCYNDGVL